MRKVNLLLLALALFITGQAATVNVSTAGTLYGTLVQNSIDPATVTDLVITGSINAQDFKDLRDSIPMLVNLDLGGASVVAYTGTDNPKSTTSTAFAANVIPDNSFYRSSGAEVKLQTIKLPSTVTKINEYAFANLKYLSSIDFNGAPLTQIGRTAFYRCYALTSVVLPNTLTEIGYYSTASSKGNVFKECTSLASVTWSTACPTIDISTFQGCTALTSLTGIENVTTINKNAFSSVGALNLNLGANVATIDSVAFVAGNVTFTVDAANAKFAAADGVLFNKDITKLLAVPSGKTSYTIPSTVVNIGGYSFSGSQIQSVVIPASVKSIYPYAFSNATKLATVNNTAAKFTYIGNNAFEKDSALVSFTLPTTLLRIAGKAFTSSGLTSITIPANVTSFEGDYVFSACASLASVTFASVSATMTDLVGKYAFYDCYNLTSVQLPPTLEKIPDGTFTFHNPLLGGAYTTALTTITLPASVQTLGNSVFANHGVLETVNLSTSLQTIGNMAFYGCKKLKNLTLPEGLLTIGTSVVQKCDSLKNITLPSTVKTILTSAFEGYLGNTSFNIPLACDSIGLKAFTATNANLTVSADNAKYIVLGNAILTKDGKRIVGSSGAVSGSFGIPSSVENIDDYAFYQNNLLTAANLPTSVKRIGAYAFGTCPAMTSLYVASEVPMVKTTSATAAGVRSTAFSGTTVANITLYVPTVDALTTYKADAFWGLFGNFVNGFVTENNETINNLSVSVYPNPVTEGFVVKNAEGNYNVSVYSLNGKLVSQMNANGEQYVNLSNLTKGAYIVKINGEKANFNQKIVKL